MRFQLNFKSGKPVYLQLVDQVKAAAAPARSSRASRCRRSVRSPRSCASTATPSPRPTPSSRARASSRPSPARAASSARPARRSGRTCASSCWPRRSTTPSSRRITCRSRKAEFLRLAEERFDAFEQTADARGAVMKPMTTDTPVIEIDNLVRRYGRTDAVNGLEPARAARPLLRVLRPQRRRQDDDDQVPAEPAAADERRGAGLRPGSGARTKWPSSRGSPTCRTTSRSIRG